MHFSMKHIMSDCETPRDSQLNIKSNSKKGKKVKEVYCKDGFSNSFQFLISPNAVKKNALHDSFESIKSHNYKYNVHASIENQLSETKKETLGAGKKCPPINATKSELEEYRLQQNSLKSYDYHRQCSETYDSDQRHPTTESPNHSYCNRSFPVDKYESHYHNHYQHHDHRHPYQIHDQQHHYQHHHDQQHNYQQYEHQHHEQRHYQNPRFHNSIESERKPQQETKSQTAILSESQKCPMYKFNSFSCDDLLRTRTNNQEMNDGDHFSPRVFHEYHEQPTSSYITHEYHYDSRYESSPYCERYPKSLEHEKYDLKSRHYQRRRSTTKESYTAIERRWSDDVQERKGYYESLYHEKEKYSQTKNNQQNSEPSDRERKTLIERYALSNPRYYDHSQQPTQTSDPSSPEFTPQRRLDSRSPEIKRGFLQQNRHSPYPTTESRNWSYGAKIEKAHNSKPVTNSIDHRSTQLYHHDKSVQSANVTSQQQYVPFVQSEAKPGTSNMVHDIVKEQLVKIVPQGIMPPKKYQFREFACEYDDCNRCYSSAHSRRQHYRRHHRGVPRPAKKKQI
eukprot:Awhi_evm1s2859